VASKGQVSVVYFERGGVRKKIAVEGVLRKDNTVCVKKGGLRKELGGKESQGKKSGTKKSDTEWDNITGGGGGGEVNKRRKNFRGLRGSFLECCTRIRIGGCNERIRRVVRMKSNNN